MTDNDLRDQVEAGEVDQLRAELDRWKQTALRLAENAHLIPKLATPAGSFTCGCRTDQGCTCPYPNATEDDRPAEDDAPNPPYDLPAGVTSWSDWSGA